MQKLARYISGLNASLTLLEKGYTQEVGALYRTLDEFHEDIIFLGIPLAEEKEPSELQLHVEYLEDFFQEEFDTPNNPFLSSQNRKTIPRKKIRASISKYTGKILNPSDAQENLRTLSQAYSGYVHGASIHIIEMINPITFQYYLDGMPNTVRQLEFINNYWNYAYRGIVLMVFVSKIFGYSIISDKCIAFQSHFESITGNSGRGDAKKLLEKIKNRSVG